MPVPMVGRADELAELEQAWVRLLSATGPAGPYTIVVTGDAGCGKSRLIATALETFDPSPGIVVFGGARVHEPEPYDWLAAVLSAQPDAGDLVAGEALAWLGQQPHSPRRRYAPGALLRLAERTVRGIVGAGPAVVVVEDLHALDPASLNLVTQLATTPGLPALVLVASRSPDEALAPQLTARTLARLAGAPRAARQHLQPLTAGDVATMVAHAYGSPVPSEIAQRLWERSAGNPYWLTELLATARGVEPATLAFGPIPEHVRRLSVGLPAARARTGPDTGRVDEPSTLHAARDHLAAGLPETALHAVELGLRDGAAQTAAERLPLLRIGARAATAAARYGDAARYATRWLESAPTADRLDRAAAHRELATASGRLGRTGECRAHLTKARTLLGAGEDDGSGSERARYLAAFAEAELRERRPAEAVAAARESLELIDVEQDPWTEGSATVTLAAALADIGDHDAGMALLRRVRRTAAEHRDLAVLGQAIDCLLTRHLPRLEESAAWHVFDEAIATATRFGLERDTGRVIVAGVELAFRFGDAARADELISTRLPLETDPERRAVLAASAGLLALECGDEPRAKALADRADADAKEADAVGGAARALATAGLLRVALGGPLDDYLQRVPPEYDRRDPGALAGAARLALTAGLPAWRVREPLRERLGDLDTAFDACPRTGAQLRCALLAAEGDDRGAVEAGIRGLVGRSGSAWLDADTRLTVGRRLLALGEVDRAREHAERAAALLARWPGRTLERADKFAASLDGAAELTAREIEVLTCLVAGMSNKQVARSLNISIRTVAVHVSNLLRKTGSASRTEAALWAVRHRLAGPREG